MDKEGRCFLYVKNDPVPKFLKEFETRIPKIYEKLALLISVYGDSTAMGIVTFVHTDRMFRSRKSTRSGNLHNKNKYNNDIIIQNHVWYWYFFFVGYSVRKKLLLLLNDLRNFIKENRFHLLILGA